MGYLKQDDEDTYFENLPEEKYDKVERLIKMYFTVKKRRVRKKLFSHIDSIVKVKK